MRTWLELEERFRALAPALQYCRLDAQWGAAGEYWRIAGSRATPATYEYEVLSALAGRFLGSVLRQDVEDERALLEVEDSKVRWYRLLMRHSPFFGDRNYGQQINEDGSSAGFIYTGSLSQMAEAAAVQCLALHASHPLKETKSGWQWFHDNYLKGIIIGAVLAVVGAILKLFIG
jgi:hypothetical protein